MKRHANEFLRTSSGRLAGSGMNEDRYDDESMPSGSTYSGQPILTKEYVDYMKKIEEEQPVKTYKLTKEEMDEYLKKVKKGVIL